MSTSTSILHCSRLLCSSSFLFSFTSFFEPLPLSVTAHVSDMRVHGVVAPPDAAQSPSAKLSSVSPSVNLMCCFGSFPRPPSDDSDLEQR